MFAYRNMIRYDPTLVGCCGVTIWLILNHFNAMMLNTKSNEFEQEMPQSDRDTGY